MPCGPGETEEERSGCGTCECRNPIFFPLSLEKHAAKNSVISVRGISPGAESNNTNISNSKNLLFQKFQEFIEFQKCIKLQKSVKFRKRFKCKLIVKFQQIAKFQKFVCHHANKQSPVLLSEI
jgi:hypothetical protein